MLLPNILLQEFPMAWVALGDGCIILDHNSDFLTMVQAEKSSLIGANISILWRQDCRDEFLNGLDRIKAAKGSPVAINVTLNAPGRPTDLRLLGRASTKGGDDDIVIFTVEPLVQMDPGAAITPFNISGTQTDSSEMLLRAGDTLAGSWIVSVNDAAEDLFGYDSEVLSNSTLVNVLNDDLNARTWTAAEVAFQAGEPFHTTLVENLGGDKSRLIEWNLTPCDSGDPQSRYWLDQRCVRTREDLPEWRRGESGLSLETDQLGDETGIWSWDLINNKFSFSQRLLKSLGYDADQFDDPIAFNSTLFHPDDISLMDGVVKSAIEDRKPYQIVVRFRAEDGCYRSILVRGQPVFNDAGETEKLVGTETEVTKQIDLSKKLLRAEQIANVGNWSRRLGQDETYWSPEIHRIFDRKDDGYEPSLSSVPLVVHPDDVELVASGERRVLRKWRVDPNMVDRIRVRTVRPDGVLRYCEISTVVEVDADGNPYELAGTLQDITDLVEAEQSLLRAQKMEVVGQLAGGAAHDFNNLLAVIMGNLELLEDEDDPEERIEYIQGALEATRRGGELTRNLLSFARKAVLNPRRLDLNAVVLGLKKVLRRVLPESIRLDVKVDADLWSLHADKASFENAVLNLAINARDAMPTGGVITLETENKILTETYVEEGQDDLAPGPYVVFSLSDSGTGMSAELMQEVFTPYFTTKPMDHGSGLGLSMVHGFARQSGGGLRLYSEVGVGTTIKLYFQASEVSVADIPGDRIAFQSGALSGRVLLVEGSAQIRLVMARRLQGMGLSCTAVGSGDEAAIAYTQEGGFDLLVTDIVMSGTDQGTGLAQQLRGQQPNLKVIFTVGYPSETTTQENGFRPEDPRLMKPVSKVDLAQAVQEVMQT